jgi:hypothetical protein
MHQRLHALHCRLGCVIATAVLSVSAFLQPSPEAWLAKIHEDPGFNSTFGPWLRTLPERGEIFAPDGMMEDEMAMLQGGPLVRIHSLCTSGQIRVYSQTLLADMQSLRQGAFLIA